MSVRCMPVSAVVKPAASLSGAQGGLSSGASQFPGVGVYTAVGRKKRHRTVAIRLGLLDGLVSS